MPPKSNRLVAHIAEMTTQSLSKGRMQPSQEADLQSQKTKLIALLAKRLGLRQGTRAADRSDIRMLATQNLILSYEALKYYERRRAAWPKELTISPD